MSFSNDPPASTPYDDTTTVYTQPVDGEFYDASMPVVEWAHELGHLMGLGDDYYHRGVTGHSYGSPLPGRADTMMADKGPHTIDQNLADRLADIASRAGTNVPGCPWTGTISSDTQRKWAGDIGNGNGLCSDHWDGDLTLMVKPDGTVSGTGTARRTAGPTCSFPFSGVTLAQQTDFSVSGTQSKDSFTLTFGFLDNVPADGTNLAGWITIDSRYPFTATPLTGPPLTIARTGSCAAAATVPTTDTIPSAGGGDVLSANNVLTLKCKTS